MNCGPKLSIQSVDSQGTMLFTRGGNLTWASPLRVAQCTRIQNIDP